MSLKIRLKHDEITPDLARQLRVAQNPQRVMEAAGLQLVSITKRSFRDASLRSSAWPDKASGGPSNLLLKGMLVSSIRIAALTGRSVTVGTDRKYGAIHQLGGVIEAKPGGRLVFTISGKKVFAKKVRMPARPYFPFLPDGSLAPFAQGKVAAVMRAALAREVGAKLT